MQSKTCHCFALMQKGLKGRSGRNGDKMGSFCYSTSCSRLLYSPSVFSRTIRMSMSWCRVATPGRLLQWITLANRSRVVLWRKNRGGLHSRVSALQLLPKVFNPGRPRPNFSLVHQLPQQYYCWETKLEQDLERLMGLAVGEGQAIEEGTWQNIQSHLAV